MSDLIQVTFVDATGERHQVDVNVDESLMEAAVIAGVPGILAECGGAPQCGSCSVKVPDQWKDTTGTPDDLENSVLKINNKLTDGYRLSCQMIAEKHWDGLTVHLPESQY